MGFRSETATITSETLAALVKQFLATERPRRLRLYEYYRGEQGVDKGRVAAGRPNNRLVSNYAKYITDVHTGYFLGQMPTFTFAGKRVQERMTRAMDRACLSTLLFEAARDMSICGEGFLLTWLEQEGPRSARLDPCGTFAITCGIREETVAVVRLQTTGNGCAAGELYLPGACRDWTFDGWDVTLGALQQLPLSALPVACFRNNGGGTGDFEPVCSLLDAYNVLLSGAMDDMQSVANAFLALYGMQGTTREDIDRANQSRVLSLAENGKAEFVVKNLSPDAIQLMQETLVRDLLSITMTPDLNDRAFSGNSSGVALEYKLWGIEQCRSAKERGFHPGLLALLEQYACSLTLLGREAAGPVQVHYHKNLPRDLTRLCENLQTLSGILSRRTRLELLPFIPDAEEELRRLKAEAESCGD